MPDLREVSPGRPPWVPAPDPWWLWAARVALVAGLAVYVVASILGVVEAITRTLRP